MLLLMHLLVISVQGNSLLLLSFSLFLYDLAIVFCLNINGWELMISLGFMAAASVRVAKGSSKAAKFSIVVKVLTSFAIGFILFFIFLFLKEKLAYIFTSSKDVADAVGDLSPLLAISILLNSVQPVLSGVAIGAGWQSIVA
ncbi:hypothetical protein GLYMA_03G005501v4 [Glycine max]|nr:hypothetical protein GLYMA_03G005501v4 [Glycine max]KAG4393036.1 hypothetical protein GLYMA_03G005501v4 [Glycine max]